MAYKAFQDYYKSAEIRHFVLHEHEGKLVSPPFCTDLNKDYNKMAVIDQEQVTYIELELPDATSKTNAIATVGEDMWFVPYGIWDELPIVVQVKNWQPVYHRLNSTGQGQYYSIASNNTSAFSFPLGYKGTNTAILMKDDKVTEIPMPETGEKLHMGTVFCNGSYWSMPRGDTPGYSKLYEYNESYGIVAHDIPGINDHITRKYTDIIVKGNTLYSLPYGETAGLVNIVEFNTVTKTFLTFEFKNDFAKKYNWGVLLNDKIIGLPYGDESTQDSDTAIIFDTLTKEIKTFKISVAFGGKYRYRAGVAHKGRAVFLPAGTLDSPIVSVDEDGNYFEKFHTHLLFSRPLIHNDRIYTLVYNVEDRTNSLVIIDDKLNVKKVLDL